MIRAAFIVMLAVATAMAQPHEYDLRSILVKSPRLRRGEVGPLLNASEASQLRSLGLLASNMSSVGSNGYLVAKSTYGKALNVTDGCSRLNALGWEAEPNYIIRTTQATAMQPNDPMWFMTKGAFDKISAPQAWGTFNYTGNSGFKVCVIDSGIAESHEEFQGGNLKGCFNAMNGLKECVDDTGHGTHCAGTIAAAGNNSRGISGIMWSAHLLVCRSFQNDEGTLDKAIQCIKWCRDQGAKITSNSWAFQTSRTTSKALYSEILTSQSSKALGGYLFITSAGNGDPGLDLDLSTTNVYPAKFNLPSIITVGASFTANDTRPTWSNFGLKSVDMYAPGDDIYSTVHLSNNSYQVRSGTSQAAPFVAGAAALLWSRHPSASATQIKSALLQGVDKVPGLVSVSGGRLNITKAMLSLMAAVSPTRPAGRR